MNGLKAIILAATLFTATQAHATTILFDEFELNEQWFGGREFRDTDWVGVYLGPHSGVNIPIGICVEPEHCKYDSPIDTGFAPHIAQGLGGYVQTTHFFSTGVPEISGRLDWFPTDRLWSVQNERYDTVPVRRGAYCVVGVDANCAALASIPEPAGIWMMAMVVFGFRWLFGRHRKLS